jgi:hypothetical protein
MDADSLLARLLTTLTPSARNSLEALGAHFDVGARCEPEQLHEVLGARGLPISPPILEAEEQVGGLEVPCYDPYLFGAYRLNVGDSVAFLKMSLHPDTGEALAPIAIGGAQGYDQTHSVAPAGSIWFQDFMSMPTSVLQAANLGVFLERIARLHDPVRRRPHAATVWGHCGEELAAALGVPFVPEASDTMERVWEEEARVITEAPDWGFIIDPGDQEEPEPIMSVQTSTEAELADVVRQLERLRPGVRYKIRTPR